VLAALAGLVRDGAVLAVPASDRPVVELAAASGRPADVVGLHLAGPGGALRVAEVVAAVRTDPGAAAAVHALCARVDVPAVSAPDRAGRIVDALLFPYLNDAVRMLEARYATADDVDAAMRFGCGYPMGPFQQLDALGLDVALDVQRRLHAEFREPGLAPAPLLAHLVTAGHLGRATGRGFREPGPR
jgi:3-hydroxybutyryl-CoA dehydrogenase